MHDRDFFLGGRSDCDLFADSQYGTFGGDVDLSLWLSGTTPKFDFYHKSVLRSYMSRATVSV